MYTNICIDIYFGMWQTAAILSEDSSSVFWTCVVHWFDKRHGVQVR